jgi:hypothetical protein
MKVRTEAEHDKDIEFPSNKNVTFNEYYYLFI